MFTGIVELIGTVTSLTTDPQTNGTILTILSSSTYLSDCTLGDSISINGTCLTVTTFSASTGSFTVGVAPETLRRTNLGSLTASSRVNLERAVLASTRMGGHFVQGHVDTVATIIDKRADGEAVVFRFRPRDAGVLKWVVEKGYVGLDGASLTITNVVDANPNANSGDRDEKEGYWEVMLITYTQDKVVMAGKGIGDEVNVEVDMVGKYVENSVRGYFEGSSHGVRIPGLESMIARIVDQQLKERS